MKLYKAIRSGTARSKDGAEKDRGHIVHLVVHNNYPSWQTAVCGIEPKGNGWYYPVETAEVTCKRCLKKSK